MVAVVSNLSSEISSKNQEIARLNQELERYKTLYKDAEERLSLNRPTRGHVDKNISATVKRLYKSLSQEEKFDVDEPYASRANIDKRKRISALITADHSSYADNDLNVALHSRYTLERRREKNKENMDQYSAYNRRISRRHSVYESRLKISRERSIHRELFETLKPADMSDLEDDGHGGLISKRPANRKEEVDNAIREIEKYTTERYRKKRTVGSPSTRTIIQN